MNYLRPLSSWTKFCSWGFAVVGEVFAVLVWTPEFRSPELTWSYAWWHIAGCEAETALPVYVAADSRRHPAINKLERERWSTRGCPDHHSHVHTHRRNTNSINYFVILRYILYLPTFLLLACIFCRKSDDCPNKYGEKKTYEKWNFSVHYYCLVSRR